MVPNNMEQKNTNILNTLKKMSSPDFIYISIFFMFLAVVAVLFLFSTSFIVNSINKIFSPTSGGTAQALNMENYTLVEKRLNLPVNLVSNSTTPSAFAAAATSSVPVAPATIHILNSTGTKGVAGVLAKALQDAGFSKATTGNQTELAPVTTILIKNSQKLDAPGIVAVVKATHPNAITNFVADTAKFDITIIIGKQ
jgi:hypothetical protein